MKEFRRDGLDHSAAEREARVRKFLSSGARVIFALFWRSFIAILTLLRAQAELPNRTLAPSDGYPRPSPGPVWGRDCPYAVETMECRLCRQLRARAPRSDAKRRNRRTSQEAGGVGGTLNLYLDRMDRLRRRVERHPPHCPSAANTTPASTDLFRWTIPTMNTLTRIASAIRLADSGSPGAGSP